jgi:hypothetical protein
MAPPRMKPEILAALQLQGRILKSMAGLCAEIEHTLSPNLKNNEGADTFSKRQGESPWDSRPSNPKS